MPDLGSVVRLFASATPAAPALGALIVASLLVSGRAASERTIAWIAQTALMASAIGSLSSFGLWALGGGVPFDLHLGRWFSAGEYGFDVVWRVDALSAPATVLVAVLVLATSRFSISYLHRERGFQRFFLLVLLFGTGMQLLVLAGSYDLLLAGWEVVGLTSVLLVGFFHERTGPVRAATRVLVTYRLCDVGFLFAVVLLHHAAHTTLFAEIFGRSAPALPATAAALGLLVAAMGKSAQVPVGGWLPRAMEGPTASSAVFYGGLSVHAGVFLLLRSWPLLEAAPIARVLLVIVGLTTAVTASASSHASADAKSALAYATIAQVGLMFVWCGLGWTSVALVHVLLHALLRYYQFLRTPSVLEDALARRAALGMTAPDEAAQRWEGMTAATRRMVYRLAVERWELEAALDRWVVRPLVRVASALDRFERRAEDIIEHPAERERERETRTVEVRS
jgi:NADH:ubiquinone oxidoreductase subunit 5 (subunit L)/multisubunit Na+/H+ antiporter MnhA subunit